MASNVDVFRKFIKEQDLYMEEGREDDGASFFRIEQRLKSGGTVIIGVGFDTTEDFVDIYVFRIAEIRDSYKRESVLKLINELNKDYRYSKFYLEENGAITSGYSMIFENNFNPNVVLRQLVLALNCVEDAYPKFMKILWS